MKLAFTLITLIFFFGISHVVTSKLRNKSSSAKQAFVEKLFNIVNRALKNTKDFSFNEKEVTKEFAQIKKATNIDLTSKIRSRLFNFPAFRLKQSVDRSEIMGKLKSYLTSSLPEKGDEVYGALKQVLDVADANQSILQLMNADFGENLTDDIESIATSYVRESTEKMISTPRFQELNPDSSEFKSEKADKEPPKPYTEDAGTNCKGFGDCQLQKLKWMGCVLISVIIRVAYEMVNIVIKMIGFIVYTLCACVGAPSGDNLQIKCNNTTGVPGVACTVPNMVYKVLFKITVFIWKAFVLLHNFCMNPIYPI